MLGTVAQKTFPTMDTLQARAGYVFHDVGFLVGLLLWSFGSIGLLFATSTIIRLRRFPFNLAWWAVTFHLGVFSTCTIELGRQMPSKFFRVLGTVSFLLKTLNSKF